MYLLAFIVTRFAHCLYIHMQGKIHTHKINNKTFETLKQIMGTFEIGLVTFCVIICPQEYGIQGMNYDIDCDLDYAIDYAIDYGIDSGI